MICELTSVNSFEPITFFDTKNGDLIISTQSASLNGSSFQYSVECISEFSYTQVLPTVQTFDVEFTFEACNSSINLNGATMADQTVYWFNNAATTPAIKDYWVSSDCNVQFTYSAFVSEGSGVFVPITEISDITFDPIARTFSMAKCSGATIQSDLECQGDAYFFSYDVIVVATLNDGEMTQNNDLRFTVTFGPDCRNDQVMHGTTFT